MHKVVHGEAISWAYQRVGQQTGKSQAYLFLLWTAMPVLSLLLILSCFPKKRCRCITDEGLLVAPSLAPLGGGDGCCGQRHAAAEPEPLFHLHWYAAWSPVSSLDEMLFPVAGSCIRSSPQRTAEPPGSSQPVPGGVLSHSFHGLYQVAPCHAVSCSTERTAMHSPSAGASHWPYIKLCTMCF